jgi:hypothetical protein
MKGVIRWICLGAMSSLLPGCAEFTVRRVTERDPYEEGVRFYRPAPYVSISLLPPPEEVSTSTLSVVETDKGGEPTNNNGEPVDGTVTTS